MEEFGWRTASPVKVSVPHADLAFDEATSDLNMYLLE